MSKIRGGDLYVVGEGKDMEDEFIEEHIDDPEDLLWGIVTKYNLDNYPSIDAEDLFQEGWLALKGAKETFDEDKPASFFTWAYRVIDNRLKNLIDKNARLSKREVSIDDERNIPLVERLPDERGLSVEEGARLETALEGLRPIEREILELHSEGYTQEEIANKPDIDFTQRHVGRVIEQTKERVRRRF